MAVFDNLNATYSQGLNAVEQYFGKTLIEEVEPKLVYMRDIQMRSLPLNNGTTQTFYKFDPFPVVTEPLKEGVTPDGQNINVRKLTMTVKPYGRHVEYTDELSTTQIGFVEQQIAKQLSRQAHKTLDAVAAEALCGGLNVIYADANGAVNTSRAAIAAGTDILTYAHVKKAVRTLEKNGAERFPDGYYHAVIDPETKYDLTECAQWVDISKYQDKSKIERYELGCMCGVKFFETPEGKKFTSPRYLYTDNNTGVASLALNGGEWDVSEKSGYFTVAKTTAYATGTDADYSYWLRRMAGQKVRIYDGTDYFDALIDRCTVDGANLKCTLRYMDTAADWAYASGDAVYAQGAGASNAAVHATVIYGVNAAGGVKLGSDGNNIQAIMHPPGSSGASDPVNQRGTVAWKVKGFCVGILQDAYIVRIEHSVSA